MVEHKVHDDPDVPLAGFRDQCLHVLHGAVGRIDVVVVGNVIAVVRLGGDVARGQPDSTHAETFQMVQLGGDAVEVPDAVAVGILEAFYIDFVGDGLLPPDEAVVRPDGLGVLRRADGGTVLPVRDHAPAQEQGAGHEQRNERNDPPEFQRNQSFLVLDPKKWGSLFAGCGHTGLPVHYSTGFAPGKQGTDIIHIPRNLPFPVSLRGASRRVRNA